MKNIKKQKFKKWKISRKKNSRNEKKLRDKKNPFIENKSTAFPFWTKPIGEILNLHVRENDFHEYKQNSVKKHCI